jgi:hypothetical protein
MNDRRCRPTWSDCCWESDLRCTAPSGHAEGFVDLRRTRDREGVDLQWFGEQRVPPSGFIKETRFERMLGELGDHSISDPCRCPRLHRDREPATSLSPNRSDPRLLSVRRPARNPIIATGRSISFNCVVVF